MFTRLRPTERVLGALCRRRYHAQSSLLDHLTERGLIQDVTRPELLREALHSKQQAVYAGVDPTASSLHIGHLIPLLCLLHFQLQGHRIIPLIGGATGRVGDPSGRQTERQLAETRTVEDNVVGLTASIQGFFHRALQYASTRVQHEKSALAEPKVLSNLDWHGSFTLLDFLQQVGIHARVNTMLNRESVKARLSAQHGLSFTEFTYQLLQAYDFHYLHKHHGCTIQIGGSDQWGNIVAGLDLINKKEPESQEAAFGIVTPLLTTASGEKFGKSAGNAVWLNPELTSVFDFYQYFVKVADADVGKYLKLFTLLPLEEIQQVLAAHEKAPENRLAQHKLAAEVTEMVHSKKGTQQAATVTRLLFDSEYGDLKASEIISAFGDDPRLVRLPSAEVQSMSVGKLAAKYKLTASNSASKTLINSRGLYLNNRPVGDAQQTIQEADLIDGRIAIVRAGKDKIMVIAPDP